MFDGGAAAARPEPQGTNPTAPASPAAAGASRLDVAVLVYDLRVSGVVLNALRIAEAARESGLACELWVMNGAGALADRVPPQLPVRHLLVSTLPLPRCAASLLSVPRLIRMLRQYRPAVLLSAGNHVHAFAAIARRTAGDTGTKLIGRISNALSATTAKRAGRLGHILRPIAARCERIQLGAMDGIIAVSQELAAQLAAHAGVMPGATTIIPNGIDLDDIAEKACEPLDHHWFDDDAPPVIVAAGRLCRQKNFTQLVRAFALLRRTAAARLVILGNGSEQERQKLLRLAVKQGVAKDIWLAGYQPNPYRFFGRARLFAMTSRWEGCSNVLIEALACGLPVVVTDHPGGLSEVLNGHDISRIVPIDDVESTAHAMLELLVRPHRPELSRAAIGSHQLADCLSRYQAVFRSALGSEAAGDSAPGGTSGAQLASP